VGKACSATHQEFILATDAAFSVSSTLVRRMEPVGQGPTPIRFDITLAPD
jgi:hypothetical protein